MFLIGNQSMAANRGGVIMKDIWLKGLFTLSLTLLVCGLVLTPNGKIFADDDPEPGAAYCFAATCNNGCYESTTLCLSIPENSTGCTGTSSCSCKCEFFIIGNLTQCLCTLKVVTP